MKFTKLLIPLFLFSAFFLVPNSVVHADYSNNDITVLIANTEGSIYASNCTVDLNANNCNILLSWGTTPATGTTNVIKNGVTTVATGLSGTNVSYPITYGTTNTFTLTNNGNVLSGAGASVTRITTTCTAGAWDPNAGACKQYNLTVNKNAASTGTGTLEGAGTYNYGTFVKPKASADVGSTFTGWGGNCSGGATSNDVTMDADKACTATFTLDTGGLTIEKIGTGKGKVTGVSLPVQTNILKTILLVRRKVFYELKDYKE